MSAAPCDPADPAYVCGVPDAEDLVRLPGAPWVLASHVNADMTASPPVAIGPGPVKAIRIDTHQVETLYPAPNVAVDWDRKTFPDCSAPKQNFMSAGLNVRPIGVNKFRLYAVNRATPFAIDVVDIDVRGERLHAVWRGCVRSPDYILANSVVSLPDDAIAFSGDKVAVWRPGRGWTKVAAYEGTSANGIEASRDGKWLYIADPGEKRVVRVASDGAPGASFITLASGPDNLRWGEDGYLYATGGDKPKELDGQPRDEFIKYIRACFAQPICDNPFIVMRLDTSAMTSAEILRGERKGAFGVATTALQMGDQIWLGTVRGDRIAIVAKP